MPVSLPAGGNGRVGTSAHEQQTYQPSASLREMVTVLGVPCQGTGPAHRDAPDLRQDEETVSRRAPLPYRLEVKECQRLRPWKRGKARLLPRLHAPEERLIRLVEPCQHVLQHVAVDGGVFGHLCPDGLQLGFLCKARDGDVAALPGGDALLERGVVERAAAPEHRI